MPKCVFSLLLVPLIGSCAPSTPQPVETPAQPLVIGTSPAAPLVIVPDGPQDAPVATASIAPLAIPARDPRLARSTRRSALVMTELKGLEQLFAASPVGSPDRPELARRLAESNAELARMSTGATAASAHRTALTFYELVVAEAPNHSHIDEVYYYAGLEYELAGKLAQARKSYYELIKSSPSSKLIPLAYFAFGELFLAEAKADPSKLEFAMQSYVEVLKYPAPANSIYADALFRLAEVYDQKGDFAKSKAMYTKLQREFPVSDAATRATSLPPP